MVSFLFFAVICFAFGLTADVKKRLLSGIVFLSGGLAIGLIMSRQCDFVDVIMLNCNPRAAIFLGMGSGLLLSATIPLSKSGN